MIGGVGAYTAALADALVDAGAEAEVVTSINAQPVASGRVRVHATVGRWDRRAWQQVTRTAQEIGAEWVHVQYQTAAFAMNPTLNLVARGNRGFRLAWTYHDLLDPYLFPKAGARLRRWTTERPASRADLVIVTNEVDRLRLARGVSNLHAIPIGSNIAGVQLSAQERSELRSHYGFGGNELLLGYFGFLNRSKGADVLVAALDLLVTSGINAHLLMIGERLGASDATNASTLAEFEAAIDNAGLTERVKWTGRLDDSSAGAALNAVDLLLLPFRDGASLRRGTLMAGLANGCAIVTTLPQHPLPELVDGRDLCYTPPSDPAAIAAAVIGLAADTERLEGLRTNARRRSEQFSWAAIAQAHLALYAAPQAARGPSA